MRPSTLISLPKHTHALGADGIRAKVRSCPRQLPSYPFMQTQHAWANPNAMSITRSYAIGKAAGAGRNTWSTATLEANAATRAARSSKGIRDN